MNDPRVRQEAAAYAAEIRDLTTSFESLVKVSKCVIETNGVMDAGVVEMTIAVRQRLRILLAIEEPA